MDYSELGERMWRALGQAPGRYGLAPDGRGFVRIGDLLVGLSGEAGIVTRGDVRRVMAAPGGERFEVEGDLIRAVRGPSPRP